MASPPGGAMAGAGPKDETGEGRACREFSESSPIRGKAATGGAVAGGGAKAGSAAAPESCGLALAVERQPRRRRKALFTLWPS